MPLFPRGDWPVVRRGASSRTFRSVTFYLEMLHMRIQRGFVGGSTARYSKFQVATLMSRPVGVV